MYKTASKRLNKSKRCVLSVTFRPSQRTLFMARRNWVPLALIHLIYHIAIDVIITSNMTSVFSKEHVNDNALIQKVQIWLFLAKVLRRMQEKKNVS